MQTLTLTVDVPESREVTITLPPTVPLGKTDIAIVIGEATPPRIRTFGDLLDSGLVGIWADRDDITDSVAFARDLRERAWKRAE